MELDLLDTDPAARVARGARYLDEYYPGWADTINVDSLHMRSTLFCTLGQAAPEGFWEGLARLRDRLYPDAPADAVGVAYGFYATEPPEDTAETDAWYDDHYDMLGDLWVEEITARRDAV